MEMEDNTIVGLPTAPMPGTPIVKHPDKVNLADCYD